MIASILCAVSSQIMIKALLDEVQSVAEGWQAVQELLSDGRLLRATVAGVLLVAFFSAHALGEAVSPRVWLGTVLILLGIVALGPTR